MCVMHVMRQLAARQTRTLERLQQASPRADVVQLWCCKGAGGKRCCSTGVGYGEGQLDWESVDTCITHLVYLTDKSSLY